MRVILGSDINGHELKMKIVELLFSSYTQNIVDIGFNLGWSAYRLPCVAAACMRCCLDYLETRYFYDLVNVMNSSHFYKI